MNNSKHARLTKLFSASSRENSNSPSLPLLSHSNVDTVTKAPQKVGLGREGGSTSTPLSNGEETAPEYIYTALPYILVILGIPASAPGTLWPVHGYQESEDPSTRIPHYTFSNPQVTGTIDLGFRRPEHPG